VDRPFFTLSSTEIEAHSKSCWNSVADLELVLAELSHRSTPKAQRLERAVRARLGELAPHIHSPNGPPRNGAGSNLDAELRAFLAEQEARRLQDELLTLRRELEHARGGGIRNGVDELFSKVGLHPNCPDFLIRTARRTWRKEFHPDALSDRPERERREAEERFKEIENVFDSIEKLRRGDTAR
jgi:hypothetical protein